MAEFLPVFDTHLSNRFRKPRLRPNETTQLPLDEFSWHLIFEDFRSSFEKIQVLLNFDKNNGNFMYMLDITMLNSS